MLRDTDPAARVPSCPDWSADDLLFHLAEVFDNWTKVVRDGQPGDEIPPPERPADHGGLLELYAQATAALLDVITTTPGDQPMWSWVAEDVTVDWLPRRMAHEALIHRLDAELAANAVTDFDPALAADGVAEVVRYFFGWRPSWGELSPGALGRLAATDTGDDWLVQVGTWSGTSPSSGNSYDGERYAALVTEGEPTFSISASARDLDAWLWGRPTFAAPSIEGDASAFEAIVAAGLD